MEARSITRWLRDNLNGSKGIVTHGGMQHIQQDFAHAVDYPTFAVVRNPWDRVVSSYFFKKKKNQISCDFESWLYNEPKRNNNWFTFKTPQGQWLTSTPTWTLRLENLLLDFKVIQEYTNCYIPLPHNNTSTRKDCKPAVIAETKNYVAIFSQDIEQFDYTF